MTTFSVSRSKTSLRYHALITALVLSVTGASSAWAADASDAAAESAERNGASETIIVTGTQFKAELAPAKASLDVAQPQTIINRPYIEDFVPPQADYVTLLAIAPSTSGLNVNGPGLSDGNVKNTLRGFPDGSFGMSYDGIPFGDTNGPSHHSVSYFPASTIGSALVDRGPGNAGTLGAATYGGTIKLFSEPLNDERQFKGKFGYGSFNTSFENLNVQSGAFGTDPTRVLVNVQHEHSDGALSFQDVREINGLLKVEHDFGQNWRVTLFSNYNNLWEHLPDKNGATPAQVAAYGKDFSMQDTNPRLATFYRYDTTRKATDMDYIQLQGDVADGLKLDNTVYTYAYTNHTFSARAITQTQADILAGVTQKMTGKNVATVNGVARPGDVPGYSKLNQFRVWGDILRLSQDYKVGGMTGQIRAGLWWEGSSTQRARYDYDMTQCAALGLYPKDWYYISGQSNPLAACSDSAQFAQGKAARTPFGYAEYDEHSSWYQYEPFLELEIHPVENLTLTPGVKYINWLHKVSAIVETGVLRPNVQSFRTKKTLPFFEANYKIQPSWSVYFQYAQGIYVPDIGVFELSQPTAAFPAPQTTTNFQVGTVYYADNFNIDADLYHISVHNNYTNQDCSLLGGPANEQCFVNTGHATYEGIEGEATYALTGSLEGAMVFASGSYNSAKSGGLWLQQSPFWTAAAGVIYKHNGWKFSLIDKTVGPQYADNSQTPGYRIPAYSTVNLSAGYEFGHYDVNVTITNLFNDRSVAAINVADATYLTNQLNSLNQLYFQAPISVMGTIKVHY